MIPTYLARSIRAAKNDTTRHNLQVAIRALVAWFNAMVCQFDCDSMLPIGAVKTTIKSNSRKTVRASQAKNGRLHKGTKTAQELDALSSAYSALENAEVCPFGTIAHHRGIDKFFLAVYPLSRIEVVKANDVELTIAMRYVGSGRYDVRIVLIPAAARKAIISGEDTTALSCVKTLLQLERATYGAITGNQAIVKCPELLEPIKFMLEAIAFSVDIRADTHLAFADTAAPDAEYGEYLTELRQVAHESVLRIERHS